VLVILGDQSWLSGVVELGDLSTKHTKVDSN
jgi:hypothetical protein